MPVVFSREVDTTTLQAGDFQITRADGSKGRLVSIVFRGTALDSKEKKAAPAADTGEVRTILLIGEFGSPENQPVQVEIVGNLLSIDGSMNFRGNNVSVTPLEEGPALVYAEIVPESEWELGKPRATGIMRFGAPGDGCPEGTQQVVRVVWAGGVTKPGGDEIDDAERTAYKVFVIGSDEEPTAIAPFAVADLADGDNNHELCLDTTAKPTRVEFPAGLMTDPIDDLNPATSISVTH